MTHTYTSIIPFTVYFIHHLLSYRDYLVAATVVDYTLRSEQRIGRWKGYNNIANTFKKKETPSSFVLSPLPSSSFFFLVLLS